MTKTSKAAAAKPDARSAALLDIAKRVLSLQTLEAQMSDGLDFREHYIVSIREALEAAYEAGRASR